MGETNLKARVERLGELARGLAREVLLWKEGTSSLLYRERKAYLDGIQKAIAGLEDARSTLAGARQRLQEKRK